MNCCEICGATEDISHADDEGRRKIYCCNRGGCGFELQKMMRDAYEAEKQMAHDEVDDRFDGGW